MTAILNKIKLVNSNSRTPIVFILGWGGASDKQLNRYSAIYEDKGCDVTRYISPFGNLSGRSFESYDKYAQDFYTRALIDVKNDVDRPIVFHAFSMNGIGLFVKVWDMLSNMQGGHALKSRVKGFVFDSGPSDTVPKTSAIAFSLATFPPNKGLFTAICRFGMYLTVYFYVTMIRVMQWLKYSTYDPLVFEREIAYYRILKLKDLPTNQLYLYSKIDTMIRFKDVDQFIEHQKALGADVKSKCWPDSHHIQHFRKYPDEYQGLCTNFLDKVLKKHN